MRAAVAQVWGAPVARTAKMNFPDCEKCRDPDLRVQWGCDSPSERCVFRTTCSVCNGGGCGGCEEGYVEHHRCPTAILREAAADLPALRTALSAYSLFSEHGVLPRPDRGLHLQSAQFVQACDVFGGERARWQRVERDYLESTARRPMKKDGA
jgi:hypothetical protein